MLNCNYGRLWVYMPQTKYFGANFHGKTPERCKEQCTLNHTELDVLRISYEIIIKLESTSVTSYSGCQLTVHRKGQKNKLPCSQNGLH